MKRTLYAAAVAVLASSPTWAGGIPVIDTANLTDGWRQHAETLIKWKYQAEQMQAQYDETSRMLSSLSHGNATQALGKVMGMAGVRMPTTPSADLPGLLRGVTHGTGSSSFLSSNRFYEPQGNDEGAQEMRRRAQGTANLQAEIQADLDMAQQRRAGLDDLIAAIDAQPDVQASAALGNRIAAEQAHLANLRQRTENLRIQMAANEQVNLQRDEQRGRRDAEQMRDRARGAFDVRW